MDEDALSQLVSGLITNELLRGSAAEVLPRRAWTLLTDDQVSLIAVQPNPAHIRMTTAVRVGVPPSMELYEYLNAMSLSLWNGRLYALVRADTLLNVVLQDTFFGDGLSESFGPGIQALISAANELTKRAIQIGAEVEAQFGGEFLPPANWMNIAA